MSIAVGGRTVYCLQVGQCTYTNYHCLFANRAANDYV